VVALVVVGLGLGLWWWLSGGVPNLTGLDVAAAQSKLTEEGYALGRVIKRHTGEKQPGTVSDQKLIPGGKVVDVYVEPYQLTATDAPDPLEKFKPVIELPDFRKHELKQAALRIMVLKIGYKVLPLHSLAATQPVVAEQSPPPGEIIDPKQQITLVYVLPAPKAPSGNDLFRNVKVLKPAATLGGLGVERMFDGAGTCFGGEHGNTLFADGLPPGFVHAVEWATETPVSLEAVRLFGTHDTVNCAAMAGFGQRGLLAFRLLGKLKENDKYEDIVNTGIQAPNNYVNGIPGLLVERGSLSVKAQFFMALFTQSTGLIPGVPHMSGPHGTPFGGPRIMEIDGFGMPLEIK
jgi:beta-lactam-binding protein with PASTA domain